VRLLHAGRGVDAVFDEANLVSCAGLVPVMRLAERVDLAGLVAGRVRPDLSTGANPGGKAAAVVAGMAAGADSIEDLATPLAGQGVEVFLDESRTSLKDRSFRPLPARERNILRGATSGRVP
jgi:hypothetical protein